MKLSENNFKESEKKLTFFSLIQATFLAIFLGGMSSKEEMQNYDIKGDWITWLKMTYTKENFTLFFSKWSKRILKFVIVFTIINTFIFLPLFIYKVKAEKHYPVARAYFTCAMKFDLLYIAPLSKVFGHGNIFTWPLYPIKDAFYDLGMKNMPEQEGEREIWWFNIRFVEYKLVIEPAIYDWDMLRTKVDKTIPKWEEKSFAKWNDELYKHLNSFPDANISDKKLKKEKLIRYIDLLDSYYWNTTALHSKLEEQKGRKQPIWADKMYSDRYEGLIKKFEDFKEYSKKYEPESYKYFEEKKQYKEEAIIYSLAKGIIGSKFQRKILTCKDPMINVFADNHTKLRDYEKEHKNALNPGQQINLQLLYSGGIPGFSNGKACIQEPSMKEYNNYCTKSINDFNNSIKRKDK